MKELVQQISELALRYKLCNADTHSLFACPRNLEISGKTQCYTIHDVEDAMAKDGHEASVSCTYARARIVGHSGLFSNVRSTIVYAAYTTLHICYSYILPGEILERKVEIFYSKRSLLTDFSQARKSSEKSVQRREPCYQ